MYTCNGQSIPSAELSRPNDEQATKYEATMNEKETNDDVNATLHTPASCDTNSSEQIRIDVINGEVAYEMNGNKGLNVNNEHLIDTHEIDLHRMFEKKTNQMNEYFNNRNGYAYMPTNGIPIPAQTRINNTKNNQILYVSQNGANNIAGDNIELNEAHKNINGNRLLNGANISSGYENGMNNSNTNAYNQLGLPSSPPPPALPMPPLQRRPIQPLPPPITNGHSQKSHANVNGTTAVLGNVKRPDDDPNDSRKGKYIVRGAAFLLPLCV